MGFCINCKKCNFHYDTKYFPEFCPRCYVEYRESEELKEAEQIIEDIIQQECGIGKRSKNNLKIGNNYFSDEGLSCYEWAFYWLKARRK